MASVSAFDVKTRFGELLRRVARGEEIVITRHDKPVARIVPEGTPGGPQGRRAAAALLELQHAIGRRSKGAKLSDAEVRSAIEANGLGAPPALALDEARPSPMQARSASFDVAISRLPANKWLFTSPRRKPRGIRVAAR